MFSQIIDEEIMRDTIVKNQKQIEKSLETYLVTDSESIFARGLNLRSELIDSEMVSSVMGDLAPDQNLETWDDTVNFLRHNPQMILKVFSSPPKRRPDHYPARVIRYPKHSNPYHSSYSRRRPRSKRNRSHKS